MDMKRLVFVIICICLLIGLPLILLQVFSNEYKTDCQFGLVNYVNKGDLMIPTDYTKRIIIDLKGKERSNELVYTIHLASAKIIDFFIQTDSSGYKKIDINNTNNLIGTDDNTYRCFEGTNKVYKGSNTTKTLYTKGGDVQIIVSNTQNTGKLYIYFRERKISSSDVERLCSIDGGNLENAPDGYQKVCTVKLDEGRNNDKIIYTFELKHDQEVGFCAYTDSKAGNVKLSLVGEHTFSDLNISGDSLICDQFIRRLPKGVYEIHLTNEKTDGITDLFVKLKG